MKLAFYRAFQPKGKGESLWRYAKRLWLDWLIAAASLGRHSHVEIVDGEWWFGISPRTGKAQMRKIEPKQGRWDFVELDLDTHYIETVYRELERYRGYRYDYIGALFSITPLCIQKPNRVFCSEVTTNILNKTLRYYYLGDGCKYSPSALYKRLTR